MSGDVLCLVLAVPSDHAGVSKPIEATGRARRRFAPTKARLQASTTGTSASMVLRLPVVANALNLPPIDLTLNSSCARARSITVASCSTQEACSRASSPGSDRARLHGGRIRPGDTLQSRNTCAVAAGAVPRASRGGFPRHDIETFGGAGTPKHRGRHPGGGCTA